MQQEPLPPLPADPLPPTTLGYAPHQPFGSDTMMSKHLDAKDILIRLKNTLLGLEYSEEDDEWKPAMRLAGYTEDGKEVMVPEGPLMEPSDVRITVSYLQSFLNSNTFLSRIDTTQTNDIMWDVSKKLAILFYNLRARLSPHIRDMLWGMVEYPILLGLNRANAKITLDAVSKTQQTHEVIQQTPRAQPSEDEQFKFFGV